MDKNSVIGLTLIAAIVIVFGYLNTPDEETAAKLQRERDSIQNLKAQVEVAEPAVVETTTEDQMEEHIDTSALAHIHGGFGLHSAGEEQFYTLENEVLKIIFSSKGARPYSVELKNHKTHDQKPLLLFDGDSTIFNMIIRAKRAEIIQTQDLFFRAIPKGQSIDFVLDNVNGSQLIYSYALDERAHLVNFNISNKKLDQTLSSNAGAVDFQWSYFQRQQEKGAENENQYSSIYFKHFKNEVDDLGARSDEDEEDIKTPLRWVAFKDQFFSSVLIANDKFDNGFIKTTKIEDEGKHIRHYELETSIALIPNQTSSFKFYFGPNKYKLLKEYEEYELSELVDLGFWIIRPINKYIILGIFNFFEGFIGSYGAIILLLTLVIKLALFPLTFKSYMSQAKMRVLKPQIDEINDRIPADKPMDRQKATMELYRKVGASPFGGCLPLLLQMPFLYAMFSFFPTAFELRQQSFLWATDLSTYDAILEWEANIPLISLIYGNHVSLFTILMTASTIFTMKLNGSSGMNNAQMPGMKNMMYIMPLMFMFILNNFSAGLTYYYFVSNMITLGQNMIFKLVVDDEEVLKKLKAHKAKPKKKSSFQDRLEKIAKERGYNAPKK